MDEKIAVVLPRTYKSSRDKWRKRIWKETLESDCVEREIRIFPVSGEPNKESRQTTNNKKTFQKFLNRVKKYKLSTASSRRVNKYCNSATFESVFKASKNVDSQYSLFFT
jgi:hypothetical protein